MNRLTVSFFTALVHLADNDKKHFRKHSAISSKNHKVYTPVPDGVTEIGLECLAPFVEVQGG